MKEHNYILCIIKTYITIVGLEIFFETIISYIFTNILKNDYAIYFNIINIYNYISYENNIYYLFIIITVLIISFILVFLRYIKKENLIINVEKNICEEVN